MPLKMLNFTKYTHIHIQHHKDTKDENTSPHGLLEFNEKIHDIKYFR